MTTFRSRLQAQARFAGEATPEREQRPGGGAGARSSRALRLRSPLLLLLALLPFALGCQRTEAFRGWCLRDPAFQIGGQVAHVRLAVEVSRLQTARRLSPNQPIRIVLTVPVGVEARFLGGDNGFGSGYAVQIQTAADLKPSANGLPVRVAAFVPMNDPTVAARVAFMPTAGNAAPASPHARGKHGKGHGSPHADLGDGTAAGFVNSWITLASTP